MSEVKPTPATEHSNPAIVTVKFFVNGHEVGMLALSPKQFSTGSTDYFTSGKVSLGDEAEKGYQAQVQLVRIGSKPK